MTNEIHKIGFFTSAAEQWQKHTEIGYGDLVGAIKNIHGCAYQAAIKAVNRYATMRNWLIGLFIVEYQQKGKDRAAYGEKLLKRLEESLHTRGLNVTLFQNCRLFYALYPQMASLFDLDIQPTLSAKSVQRPIQPMPSAKSYTNAQVMIERLSFSHICELIHVNDDAVKSCRRQDAVTDRDGSQHLLLLLLFLSLRTHEEEIKERDQRHEIKDHHRGRSARCSSS